MRTQPSFCIHGHFYQPPREDPFTRLIPVEGGAAPYQNWNEHVLATCYQPNAELRNFSRISFNMGPTLARWMRSAAPQVLDKIITEDKVNQAIYGAGNAIAQSYNHTILPLANSHDKRTQIRWGIIAFEQIFGRQPEGMWLPETAVDDETLSILEENGIAFTILAPWQVEVIEGQSPYIIQLKNGRTIIAFVYHGSLSSTMSFDTFATGNADAFAEYYIKPEIDPFRADQFILIATDGELYGHHQPFRDKFLAHLLDGPVKNLGINQTWPSLWLKQHPVNGKARIVENTSWSCHHGVDRWRCECICTPGSTWKEPLRKGFDQLNEAIFEDFKNLASAMGFDPFFARDEYIKIVLGGILFRDWVKTVTTKGLTDEEISLAEKAFAAQYACQQMFTSCGWFFDDLLRIEPRNNIIYAAHAAYLMHSVTGVDYSKLVVNVLRNIVDEKNQQTAADLFLSAYRRFENS